MFSPLFDSSSSKGSGNMWMISSSGISLKVVVSSATSSQIGVVGYDVKCLGGEFGIEDVLTSAGSDWEASFLWNAWDGGEIRFAVKF